MDHPESTRNTVAALFSQGLNSKEIASETGVNHNTVRTWINRLKLQQTRSRAKEVMKQRHGGLLAVIQVAHKPHAAPSSRLREGLSAEVASQMAVLQAEPVKRISELGNTRDREGRASVVKRLVDSAAILEDWESQRTPGIVVMSESMVPADEAQPTRDIAAIDVGSEPDPAAEAIKALQEE